MPPHKLSLLVPSTHWSPAHTQPLFNRIIHGVDGAGDGGDGEHVEGYAEEMVYSEEGVGFVKRAGVVVGVGGEGHVSGKWDGDD